MPAWRWVCLALLGISLGCNLMVFFVPFMNLRMGVSNEPYTIFHTVQLLWKHDMFALAVMVFLFSICFPFFKLTVLFRVVLFPSLSARWAALLRWVERFAKWSMLDVFLVILVLSVTNDQFLVGSTPREGLLWFVTAIVLSMGVGQAVHRKLCGNSKEPPRGERFGSLIPERWLAGAALLVLLLTFFLPFLQISDWLLADRSFSLVGIIPILWAEASPLSAVIVILFLVLAPLFLQVSILLDAFGFGVPERWQRWFFYARKWTMLEVFALAYAIFILESDYLVRTEARMGGLFLVLMIVIHVFLAGAYQRLAGTTEKEY